MERKIITIFHEDDIRKVLQRASPDHTDFMLEGGFTYEADVEISHGEHLSIGSFGTRPAILSGGLSGGIHIINCTDVEISGLIVKGDGWNVNRGQVGILVEDSRDIVIRNVETFGFQYAGIGIRSSGNVTVEGCYAHNNGYCGIGSFTGQSQNNNLWIRHCKALDNGGDPTIKDNHSGSGIAIFHAKDVMVEYCEAAGNGWAQRQKNINGPVGIWCACDVRNVMFRKNISRHNRTQPGGVDGDGFDIDGGVFGGWMEHNYSYENEGSGYLFCEYGSGLDFKNNHMRYCISLMDARRVSRQGSVQYYGPPGLSLQNSWTRDCLFVPAWGRHCIVNSEVGKDCKDIAVTDCVLVESDVPAVSKMENPFTSIHDNLIMSDKELYRRIQDHVPALTNPRALDGLPVFRHLEDRTLADVLKCDSILELFGMTAEEPMDSGSLQFVYDLNGRDFEGSDILRNARLCFDSIKPGYALKLEDRTARVQFKYPALEQGKCHIAVLRARIESPGTEACFYIAEENRIVNSVMLTGTVSEYHSFLLPFKSTENSLDIGIGRTGGEGAVYCEKISFYKISDEKTDETDDPIRSDSREGDLSSYAATGDVYTDHSSIFLNGQGSALTGYQRIPEKSGRMALSAVIDTGECKGMLFIESGRQIKTLLLSNLKREYEMKFEMEDADADADGSDDSDDIAKKCPFIRYGVIHTGGKNNGKIEIVKFELK